MLNSAGKRHPLKISREKFCSKMASLKSDSCQLIFCASREEMLEKFEEYKRKTQSGWRCINSNTLFGKCTFT